MSYDNIGRYRQIQRERAQQSAAPMDEIDRLEQARKALPPSWVPGWAEIPATLASGAASSAAGGLAGLGTAGLNALGLSKADPGAVLSSIQQDYTYAPRTVEGMAGTYAAGKAFEALHKPVARAADMTLAATGDPALATAVDVGPTALGALMGLPTATGRGALSAARSAVPELSPSSPGLGLGLARQRGSIGPAELMVGPELTRRATTMGAAGRSAYDIWKKTGVWAPTPYGPPVPNGIPLAEIPDTAAGMTPRNLAPPPDPSAVQRLMIELSVYDTMMKYAEMKAKGIPHEEIQAAIKGLPGASRIPPGAPITTGQVVFGQKLTDSKLKALYAPQYAGTVGEAFDQPDLFAKIPRLKDIRFRVDPYAKFAGSYYPEQNLLEVSSANRPDKAEINTPQIVAHEIGHGIQRHTGLPGGMDPSRARTDLIESHKRGLVSDSLFERLRRMSSDDVYHRAWGEGLSNATMHAVGWDERMRREIPPWARMTDKAGEPIDPFEFWTPYR